MSRLNFFIGLFLGAIGGWLGDVFFGRTKLEDQVAALRSERMVIQGQLKDAERVIATQSAEIADLKAAADKVNAIAAPAEAEAPTSTSTTTVVSQIVEQSNEPDNLRLIEGIGPKAAGVLAQAGVSTFTQMAAMDGEALMAILKEAKLRGKFYTDSWPEQAAIAASGDFEALTQLQNELVGGRRVG